jgi:hypothetical protein
MPCECKGGMSFKMAKFHSQKNRVHPQDLRRWTQESGYVVSKLENKHTMASSKGSTLRYNGVGKFMGPQEGCRQTIVIRNSNSYRDLGTFQWTHLRCSMSSWVVKFLWGQGYAKKCHIVF